MKLTSGRVAEYALDVSYDEFDDTVVQQTKDLILDSMGTSIGAFASPPSKALRAAYGTRPAGDAGATVFGSGREVPVEYAALINGAMVRYLDFNDCYISASVCHPSDHIPGLMAVAEQVEATGEELVEAIVVAYEVQCAGVDTGAIWDNGFDYVTWGAYSSAAAVGKLMDLSEDQLTHALGIVGTSTNGILASRLGDVSMWKGVAQPYVTHNAIQACQMAESGLTGPTKVFEGEGGFFEVIAREEVHVDDWGGRDGAPFRIEHTNIKPFACGYFMQSPITAAMDLKETHGIDPDCITSIDVEEFEQAVQVLASPEKWSTKMNRETADHSIPYTVSVALLYGAVTPRQYEEDRLRNPAVHDLMEKVSVREAEDLTRRRQNNPGLIPARVRIETAQDSYEAEIDYPRGHWKQPMTDEELQSKFRGLAGSFMTDEQIQDVIHACNGVDEVGAEGIVEWMII